MLVFREPRRYEWTPFDWWSAKLVARVIFVCQMICFAGLATWLLVMWRTFR